MKQTVSVKERIKALKSDLESHVRMMQQYDRERAVAQRNYELESAGFNTKLYQLSQIAESAPDAE